MELILQKHFYYFVNEFELVDVRDMTPMQDTISRF